MRCAASRTSSACRTSHADTEILSASNNAVACHHAPPWAPETRTTTDADGVNFNRRRSAVQCSASLWCAEVNLIRTRAANAHMYTYSSCGRGSVRWFGGTDSVCFPYCFRVTVTKRSWPRRTHFKHVSNAKSQVHRSHNLHV